MKALALTLILSLCGAAGFAQTQLAIPIAGAISAPPKGSNAMIITLADSGLTAWKSTANTLLKSGYAIKSAQSELLTVNTEPKTGGRGGLQVSLFASVEGNQVTLTGQFFIPIPGFDSAPSPIEFKGMKGSGNMQAWAELEKVAQALGGTVTYARR